MFYESYFYESVKRKHSSEVTFQTKFAHLWFAKANFTVIIKHGHNANIDLPHVHIFDNVQNCLYFTMIQ